MHCDGCHDINWLHERPSLVCLRGQLVSPIRTLEVALLWIQLFTEFILTDNDYWHIDDREHCLQGRSIVMISVSVNVTALIRLRGCLGATASMWETLGGNVMNFHNVNIFTIFSTGQCEWYWRDYFSTLRIVLDCSTVPYWAGASPGLGQTRVPKACKKSARTEAHMINIK